MNTTVELVNEWGRFEARHPDAGIEDFCRHYLISQREKDHKGPILGGDVPMNPNGLLLKMIGRIHKLNAIFAAKALEGTELTQVEEFGMLLTIRRLKNPRKTEIIYANIFELSSGTDMLNRLKARNLIAEYADKEDKRSKRVKLTAAGEKMIETGAKRMGKCAGMMLAELGEEDVQLCTQLLNNVEVKFAALWQEYKAASFEDIFKHAEAMRVDKRK
jgi:DNA-binding MarR family transcriptional regulator